MKHKTMSTTTFCAEVLLADVQHYKGDAFITYDQINAMELNSFAVIMTRECGVEFISKNTVEPLYVFDAWSAQAVRCFIVKRTTDALFGFPAVDFIEVSAEVARDRVLVWEESKFERFEFMSKYTNERFTYEDMLDKYNLADTTTFDRLAAFDRLAELTKSGAEFYLVNPKTNA